MLNTIWNKLSRCYTGNPRYAARWRSIARLAGVMLMQIININSQAYCMAAGKACRDRKSWHTLRS